MRFKMDTVGLFEAADMVDGMAERASNPTAVLRARATRHELEQSGERRFRRGLKPDKASTIVSKRKRGLSTRTMEATGATRAAVTAGRGAAAGAIVFRADRDGVRWGVRPGPSRLQHLHVHARGYRNGGRVPPRRVFVIDAVATDRIAARVVANVAEGTA